MSQADPPYAPSRSDNRTKASSFERVTPAAVARLAVSRTTIERAINQIFVAILVFGAIIALSNLTGYQLKVYADWFQLDLEEHTIASWYFVTASLISGGLMICFSATNERAPGYTKTSWRIIGSFVIAVAVIRETNLFWFAEPLVTFLLHDSWYVGKAVLLLLAVTALAYVFVLVKSLLRISWYEAFVFALPAALFLFEKISPRALAFTGVIYDAHTLTDDSPNWTRALCILNLITVVLLVRLVLRHAAVLMPRARLELT